MERIKRKNRSDAYQVYFHESSCSNEMLASFSNDDSMNKRLNPFDYDEDILVLEDELKVEFWRIVDSLLTARQKEVIHLSSEGKTQMEIAKILNVNQSSVTKSLNGNVDYKNGKKTYGGTKRKISKIIQGDKKIIEILNKIKELREAKH